ncbi:MAG: hypothetical protein K2K64_09465 [Muribaculaceae bacterium]|nr:hypothetical protein [Muribaculaceae bacterium]
MNEIKMITPPELKSARKLKPLELNGIRIGRKHSVLTPQQLEEIARSGKDSIQ